MLRFGSLKVLDWTKIWSNLISCHSVFLNFLSNKMEDVGFAFEVLELIKNRMKLNRL